ncbi:melatonin receptor type 1B-B-like [Patiria miniata]|uniref:G-protein coupled receptors family 1 profile domain-containing protein n=1 Tax=Patiria miniata TaxID=46514 RepID=A0A913ZKV0_PATMI|nr:melatonin receptor type 1B-B-like [Patiria miniata]
MDITEPTVDVTVTAEGVIDNSDEISINIVFLICTIIMLCMGLVGNVLVIGAVLVHRRLRVLGNVFVINLAIADMCVTIFVDTFSIVGIATDGRFFDTQQALCDMVGVICVTSCSCSMWNIGHISLNRYMRICHGKLYPRVYNRRTIPFILAVTWTLCFLIDLPNLVGWGAHAFDARIMMCTYDYTESYTYTLYFIGWGFGFPLVVTSYSYLRIIYVVKQAERNARKANDVQTVSKAVSGTTRPAGTSKESQKRVPRIGNTDIRLLRSVFTIWIVFLVMWSPYAITVLGDTQYLWPTDVYVVAVILAHTNSSINGILYAATNRHFREGYGYLIRRCLRGRRVSPGAVDTESTVLMRPQEKSTSTR